MGWTAAGDRLDAGGLSLFAVLVFWQIPHFLSISLHRRDDFEAAGIRVFSVSHGDRVTRRLIVASSAALALVTLTPWAAGVGGPVYLAAAAVTGVLLVRRAWAGLRAGAPVDWPRRFFLGTLHHLPALFGALILERLAT
jgi:protoheme IX farnesyltransferase